MDTGVDVPTPAQVCAAKAQGHDGPDVDRRRQRQHRPVVAAVADRFVATIVPILKANNFDGIDIDIEAGLTGSGSIGHAVDVAGQPRPDHRRGPRPDARRLRSDHGARDRLRDGRLGGLRVDLGLLPADHQEVRRQRPALVAEHAVLQRLDVRLRRQLLRRRHGRGLRRADPVPRRRPDRAGHDDPGAVRQAGPRPPGPARRGRRLHVAGARLAGVVAARRRAQGAHDLVDQLGRVEGLDVRRQREVADRRRRSRRRRRRPRPRRTPTPTPTSTPTPTPTPTVSPTTPSGTWAAYKAYTVGDVVTYGGTRYTCRQAHTSLPGWEPPNVLALWLPV